MPQHVTMTVPPRSWTQLTDADVSALRAQLQSGSDCLLQATATAVAPASTAGAILLRLGPATAILPSDTLADLFPGVAGAKRVWCWAEAGAVISVSHA